ncbi:MAG TPA: hypothetical protein HPQ00_08815, partial [Magnetococcales bacterium]|nr:hypothetical protein [Magnetococcales bacterium]
MEFIMRISRVKTLATFGLLSLSLASCAPPAAKEGWNYDGFKQWHPHSGQAAIGKAGTQCFFCEIKDMDSDGDGVMDKLDKCPGTSKGLAVDAKGCPRDSDGDGVSDDMDNCPGTPPGAVVNQVGCPTAAAATVDNDADGVIDSQDNCPGTPTGAQVNSSGCWVLENLHFDSSKAVIKPVDFPLL